jgi:hypothetical protein
MASITSCAQSGQKKDIPQDCLDSLCVAMSDECRGVSMNTASYISESFSDWFPKYLKETYDTVGTPHINVSEKQLTEGTLRRIAEGKIRIEERADFSRTYNYPAEMSETEYFFLNNELVKISVAKGHTDYNFIPSAYWIMVFQLDLLCQKNEIVNRKAYWCSGDKNRTQVEVEKFEYYIRDLDINENALIQKAHTLKNR